MKIHITKQGESLDSIANTYAISRQDLTGINPHINLSSELVPGLKLKIPEANRAEKVDHIEKFYPNLEQNTYLKEQAVPIGMKPFDQSHTMNPHESVTPHQPHPHAHEGPPTQPHPHVHEGPPAQPHPHVYEGSPTQPQTPWGHLGEQTTYLTPNASQHYHPWNQPFPTFSPPDTRVILPPVPYYPPYPPYGYPGYGYGAPFPLPFPVPGFGPGYGFGHGWHGGGHFGGGHFGGGHHR
ncbi:MAG: LysM domain-containing protein [Defluviitaleaceae bacterium]|nr:LysM domain-containing protein [Defluviitaleaceae bacterium]